MQLYQAAPNMQLDLRLCCCVADHLLRQRPQRSVCVFLPQLQLHPKRLHAKQLQSLPSLLHASRLASKLMTHHDSAEYGPDDLALETGPRQPADVCVLVEDLPDWHVLQVLLGCHWNLVLVLT